MTFTPIVSVNDICVNFGGVRALKNVDLTIMDNDIIGLIGPNGSGKSTLINVITGYQSMASGVVSYFGENVSERDKISLANLGMCRTFQTPRVFRDYTVVENMLVALYAPSKKGAVVFGDITLQPSASFQEKQEFCKVVLGDFRDIFNHEEAVGTFSYGKLRILELCMCLVRNPKIMFLDELTSGLNDQETEVISVTVAGLASRLNIPIVIIDHKFSFIKQLCNRVIVINEGSLIYDGVPNLVTEDQQVREVYFGGRPC